MNNHSFWLAKLARLRIDTASNAPHKPLLLLVVLDLAQESAFGPDLLPLMPQLAFRFCSYWQIVAHRRKQKPDVRWPFTKLKTENVWTPLDARGEPTAEPKQACMAKLNAGFVAAANDPAFRERANNGAASAKAKPAAPSTVSPMTPCPLVPTNRCRHASAGNGSRRRSNSPVRFAAN